MVSVYNASDMAILSAVVAIIVLFANMKDTDTSHLYIHEAHY